MENRWKRYPFLAVDALSMAQYHNPNRRSVRELFNEVVDSPNGKTGRFMAITHLVEKIVPGTEEFLSELLLSFENLPMRVDKVEFAGRGGEQNVFKVQSGEKVFALKINKISQLYDGVELGNLIKQVKEDYQLICDWYGHIRDFIPEEVFFIGHSPVLGVSALITLQPFINREMRGFFEDFTREKLVNVLGEDESLKGSYLLFADKLSSLWRKKRRCIDLLGEKNLSVLGRKEDRSLCFSDPHVIYDEDDMPISWKKNIKSVTDRLEERVSLVEKIAEQVG